MQLLMMLVTTDASTGSCPAIISCHDDSQGAAGAPELILLPTKDIFESTAPCTPPPTVMHLQSNKGSTQSDPKQ
jgi:hypothetical protein